MSDRQDPDPSFTVASRDTNWVRGSLIHRLLTNPVRNFIQLPRHLYAFGDRSESNRQTTLSFLRPRLFEPLGISGIDWEDTRGINTGGWGLRLKTEDMAKFAQLFCKRKMARQTGFTCRLGRRGQQHEDHAGPQMRRSQRRIPVIGCRVIVTRMWRCRNNAISGRRRVRSIHDRDAR